MGPRLNPVTAASTLNCSSTPVIAAIMSSLAALLSFGGSPATSRSSEGSVYGPSITRSTTGICGFGLAFLVDLTTGAGLGAGGAGGSGAATASSSIG
ncbi:Uncharacterised protein [Mycobacteroides abscessus subsp. abscessus]|nr:Uncharacterised protein [Mycobacteroides abscessus subsp. abscessus]